MISNKAGRIVLVSALALGASACNKSYCDTGDTSFLDTSDTSYTGARLRKADSGWRVRFRGDDEAAETRQAIESRERVEAKGR